MGGQRTIYSLWGRKGKIIYFLPYNHRQTKQQAHTGSRLILHTSLPACKCNTHTQTRDLRPWLCIDEHTRPHLVSAHSNLGNLRTGRTQWHELSETHESVSKTVKGAGKASNGEGGASGQVRASPRAPGPEPGAARTPGPRRPPSGTASRLPGRPELPCPARPLSGAAEKICAFAWPRFEIRSRGAGSDA